MTDTNNVEPVAYVERITGRLATPTDEHRIRFPKVYDPIYPASTLAALQQEHVERLLRIELKVDELIAERDTLRTQLAEAQAENEELRLELSTNTNRRDTLRWQRDAAQADAARYRWLRDMDEQPVYSLAAIFTDCQGSAESISLRIDQAVDTLMRMPK